MTEAELRAVGQAIVRELELCSTASAAQLERTHSGKPDTQAPPPTDAPHLRNRRLIEDCRDEEQLRQAVELALDELCEIRHGLKGRGLHKDDQGHFLDLGTQEDRVIVGTDTRPAWVVARDYGCSPRTIQSYRKEARKLGFLTRSRGHHRPAEILEHAA